MRAMTRPQRIEIGGVEYGQDELRCYDVVIGEKWSAAIWGIGTGIKFKPMH